MKIVSLIAVLVATAAVTALGQDGAVQDVKHGAKKTGETIKDGLETAGEKTKETAKTVGKKTKEAAETVGEKTKETGETVARKTKETFEGTGEKTTHTSKDLHRKPTRRSTKAATETEEKPRDASSTPSPGTVWCDLDAFSVMLSGAKHLWISLGVWSENQRFLASLRMTAEFNNFVSSSLLRSID
jgi:hypothetical protein